MLTAPATAPARPPIPRGRKPGIPKYRVKIVRGRPVGYVTLADAETGRRRDYWLGNDGDAARERYARVTAEWLAAGRRTPDAGRVFRPQAGDLSVTQLCREFLAWASRRYTPSECACHKAAIRVLRGLYGTTAAVAFGPNCLRAVRAAMIAGTDERRPWARGTVNNQIQRVKAIWRFAAAHELLPVALYEALRTLEPLRFGEAPDPAPVGPAPEADVAAVMPHVAPQVRAMIELQRLTGMRPGEVVIMRTRDIVMAGPTWCYTPHRHKGTHRRHSRTVWLGPQARQVLAPWLLQQDGGYLFSAVEAVTSKRASRHAARVTPPGQGNEPGTNVTDNPRRGAGDKYRRDSYTRAIARACDVAGVPRWHPHQLRHSYATRVRAAHGVEIARVMLGHRNVSTTEIYAERDAATAVRVAQELG